MKFGAFVELSDREELMVMHGRRPGFLDRRYRGPLTPRPYEKWEVEVVGENPRKTVFFWRPVRRVWPQVYFPDQLEVEGVVFTLDLKYGVYVGEVGSCHLRDSLEATQACLAELVERERWREEMRQKWGPIFKKAIEDGPTSPMPEIPPSAPYSLCRHTYVLAERIIQPNPQVREWVELEAETGGLTAYRRTCCYLSGRDMGRPAGSKGEDFTRTEEIPLPEWFRPEDYQQDILTAKAYWAWWWEVEMDIWVAADLWRAWLKESLNNWLYWHQAYVGEDGRIYAYFGEDCCEVLVPEV